MTGAASGIGRATALAFAREGARVVVADIEPVGNLETAHLICKAGGTALAVEADVSQPEDVEHFVDVAWHAFGRLDHACNSAELKGASVPTADYRLDDWDRVLAVNLRGAWLCMRSEISRMLQGGGGSIVNIAVSLGTVGSANAAYTAAKHGVLGLTRAAALEYAGQGIRINALCPAYLAPPMLERPGASHDPRRFDAVKHLYPIRGLATAEEVAEAVLWLSSPGSSFVAGHALLVDGSCTAR